MDIQYVSQASGRPAWEFNCGAFALGVPHRGWFTPSRYSDIMRWCVDSDELLEECAEAIEREFEGEWRRVKTWRGVPKNRTLIAFKVEASRFEREGYSDFHFLVRIEGKWWHKMGGRTIERVKFRVLDVWREAFLRYDSDTAWFVRVDED